MAPQWGQRTVPGMAVPPLPSRPVSAGRSALRRLTDSEASGLRRAGQEHPTPAPASRQASILSNPGQTWKPLLTPPFLSLSPVLFSLLLPPGISSPSSSVLSVLHPLSVPSVSSVAAFSPRCPLRLGVSALSHALTPTGPLPAPHGAGTRPRHSLRSVRLRDGSRGASALSLSSVPLSRERRRPQFEAFLILTKFPQQVDRFPHGDGTEAEALPDAVQRPVQPTALLVPVSF